MKITQILQESQKQYMTESNKLNLQNLTVHDIREIFEIHTINQINERFFPSLYQKDNKGKIRVWRVWLKEEDPYVTVMISYGVLDGKQITQEEVVTSGKNLGKKNETTIPMQAFIVARKYFHRQLDKGYVDSLDKLNSEEYKVILPMLAHNFHKFSHKINVPFLVSPKLDGIRSLAQKNSNGEVVFTTRKGKTISSVDHLKEHLYNTLNPGEIVDGELYNHSISFQDLTSKIRKENQTDYNIEYYIFDKVSQDDYYARYEQMETIVQGSSNIHVVQIHEVSSFDEVKEWHDYYVSYGYEGVMIRNIDAPYEQGKRSYNIQKFKTFDDDEFKIIDVIEGKNNQGVFVCETKEGKEFNVRPKGKDSYREYILNNPNEFIGEMLTVRFFGWTNDNVPRFPVGIEIRDYE